VTAQDWPAARALDSPVAPRERLRGKRGPWKWRPEPQAGRFEPHQDWRSPEERAVAPWVREPGTVPAVAFAQAGQEQPPR